jgi:hypothetical protein
MLPFLLLSVCKTASSARLRQGTPFLFLQIPTYYAFGSGAGKLPARRRHWGQGIFPLQAVQNVHLRDACALAAPGGESLGPPAAGLSFRGRLPFISRNGNSVSIEAKTTQIPFLEAVL